MCNKCNLNEIIFEFLLWKIKNKIRPFVVLPSFKLFGYSLFSWWNIFLVYDINLNFPSRSHEKALYFFIIINKNIILF